MSRARYEAYYLASTSASAAVAGGAVARAAVATTSVNYVAVTQSGSAVSRGGAAIVPQVVPLGGAVARAHATSAYVVAVSIQPEPGLGLALSLVPLSETAVTSFGQVVAQDLQAWGGAGTDWQSWITAMGTMFQPVWSIVANAGSPDEPGYMPGWSTLLSLSQCPTQFLPFLAMFVGASIPAGSTDQQARQIIAAEAAFNRGTVSSILTAANAYAIQPCQILERQRPNGTADPYFFTLVVVPETVPNPSALTAAVNRVKPAGLQWALLDLNGYLWEQQIREWTADTRTWQQALTTL